MCEGREGETAGMSVIQLLLGKTKRKHISKSRKKEEEEDGKFS